MRLVNTGVATVVLTLLVAACQATTASPSAPGSVSPGSVPPASGQPPTSPASEQTLTFLGIESTQGLDPNIGVTDSSRVMMSYFFSGLVEVDQDGHLVGAIAESWDITDGGSAWTFKIRPEAGFSDGTTISADDVKWSIDRMKEGQALKAGLANVTEVTVVDPKTVQVKLSSPTRQLAAVLATFGSASILSKAAVEADPTYFLKPSATSGAWTLDVYLVKDHADFKANPHYWRTGYPKVANLRMIFGADAAGVSGADAVEAGVLDFAGVGYQDAERVRGEGKLPVYQTDSLTPLFWGFDRTSAPFNDKRVRQAFAFGYDRQARIDACWFGTGAVTWGSLLRPWDPMYTELDTYKTASRDEALQKAGALLDAAGWKLGSAGTRTAQGVDGVADGSPLEVTVPYEGNWPAAECSTLLLQQNMKDLGVNIKPEKYDPAAFWTDVAAGKFKMYHGGAGASNASDLYLNWFVPGGTLTALTTHLDDPAITDQVKAAAEEPDPAKAKQLFAALEEWQADELPMLAVGYQWPQSVLSPKLSGFWGGYGSGNRGLIETSKAP